MIEPIIVDFETDGIVGNPLLKPPKPCGVSIKWPGYDPSYFAWGHPTKNNCSRENGALALAQVWNSGEPMCFHNAPFDLSVWRSMPEFREIIPQFGRRFPRQRIHDTTFLVFLADPYAASFSLKPSAARWLKLPPEEQDRLRDWILLNVPGATLDDWAAHISKAPGDLVGVYANGDSIRTDGLFRLLYPSIIEQGMLVAYERERRLMPTLCEATIRGVRCDRGQLFSDQQLYTAALDAAEARLCKRIGITPAQLEDDEEAMKDGLERSGAVTEWVLTPKSRKRSMAAGNLRIVVPEIRDLLDYRGALKTSLQTFIRPWLAMSEGDGRLHPNWNSVRQAKGDWGSKGARTGRMSSDSPNFQNLPTEWEYRDGTPMAVPAGLPPYPMLRRYILPELGHVWLKRDFSSQEIRILAHFEDGSLRDAYIADPTMDPHEMAQKLIHEITGLLHARRPVKITGFSIIYGAGVPGLSAQLGVSAEEARTLKNGYLRAMPGVDELMREVQNEGRAGRGIRTWGGRVYFAEPAKMVEGRMRDFFYKLLNYLIQGSAADQTKDCIVEWDAMRDEGVLLLAAVHDEINISAPTEWAADHMADLRVTMERDRFDVPFRTEGFVGENWADLKECA